jgi:hypothetical protein
MPSTYKKNIARNDHGISDVYDVLVAYDVTNPAIAHAVKKLLCAGKRNGGKSVRQDYQEAIDSIQRAIELEGEE